MAQKKQLLHELLKEKQGPFQLENYIAERKSQLKKSNALLRKRRREDVRQNASNKNSFRNACFLSFNSSTDVTNSAFIDIPSPGTDGGVILHVPSATAAILLEAAMRIQKRRRWKSRERKNLGTGLFGSLLKKIQGRIMGHSDGQMAEEIVGGEEESSSISSDGDKSFDFGASTNDFGCEEMTGDFIFNSHGYCISPFTFSFLKTPSFSVGKTPEFHSPVASSVHCLNPENDGCEARNSRGEIDKEEENEKDHNSPVSILEPPFDDDSRGADEEIDIDKCCENLERARKKLLHNQRLPLLKGKNNLGILRINKLGVRRVFDFDTICLDSKKGAVDEWGLRKCEKEEAEEITGEIEVVICGILVEELVTTLSVMC